MEAHSFEGKKTKERRLFRKNQSQNKKQSSGSNFVKSSESFPTRKKIVPQSTRKRIQEGNPKSRSKLVGDHGDHDETHVKKVAFDSLNTLFDVKKPLNLLEIQNLLSNNLKKDKPVNEIDDKFVETLFLQSLSQQSLDYNKDSYEGGKIDLSRLYEGDFKSNTGLSEELDPSTVSDNNYIIEELSEMAETDNENVGEEISNYDENEAGEMESHSKDKVKFDSLIENIGEPPSFPIPSGIGEGIEIKPGERGESIVDVSPLTNPVVMNDMDKAAERCKEINREIDQLQRQLMALKEKSDLTDEDTLTIHEQQNNVMSKLAECEMMTRTFQRLLGLNDPNSSTFAKMFEILPFPHDKLDEEQGRVNAFAFDGKSSVDDLFDTLPEEYPEDKLPKLIVCGPTEDNMPKIVVADGERRGKNKYSQELTEPSSLEEKSKLEAARFKFEQKDSIVENLERKVCGLQAEIRMIVKENTELNRQVTCLNQRFTDPRNTQKSALSIKVPRSKSLFLENNVVCQCSYCAQQSTGGEGIRLGGGASNTETRRLVKGDTMTTFTKTPARGTCPAEWDDKLVGYGNNTKQLEQQLGNMESEVRTMQMELANVQRERQQLEQQRKLLKCTGPCSPCGCPQASGNIPSQSVPGYVPPMLPSPSISSLPHAKVTQCPGPCATAPVGTGACPQQQLRDLREQYARLQDDYKNKLCEVSNLRADSDKLKQDARRAKEDKDRVEIKMSDVQERLKILEAERDKFTGNKEQLMEQEQALLVAKQRFRETQDELEELRALIQDQATQLEDYRNKYLQAQQVVEEQRRQLDLMEMDNARMNENVTMEIGRVKNQFQEKLSELAPLPDLLKQTQVKLQETQQMRLSAERNCEDLSREVLGCKDKIQTLQNQLDQLRNEYQMLQDERGTGAGRFEELEKQNTDLRHDNERMKNALARVEEHEAQLQKRIDEKMHEITQLNALLEQVREDSARQVARTKERCETVRRGMQSQIAEMERQLAQCRATSKSAQKDRDEIRQKMQGQINNLNEAFEQAQGRIRSLQGHVNYLKTSYSNIFKGSGEVPAASILPGDTLGAGYDSCDCNF